MREPIAARITFYCILGIAVAGVVRAGSTNEIYQDLEATISAPDTPAAFVDFPVGVEGTILGGDSSDVFAYAVYEDAEWVYDVNHRVDVLSGTLIDQSPFEWGFEYFNSYIFNKPEGSYTYTFIMGFRSSNHDWYDLAVDLTVDVGFTPSVVNLLRNDELLQLGPPVPALSEIFVAETNGNGTALDPLGDDGTSQPGEGARQSTNGSSDDDDFYLEDVSSGVMDPDPSVGSDPDRPLVFYELDVPAIRTLRVGKTPAHEIVLTW